MFTFSVDEQHPAELEDFVDGAGMTPGENKDGVVKPQTHILQTSDVRGREVSPLFATAVNSGGLLRWRLEDGLEDGDVLLEDDGRNREVPLQLVGALAKFLREAGHVLPLLHLVKELYEAGSRDQQPDSHVHQHVNTSHPLNMRMTLLVE